MSDRCLQRNSDLQLAYCRTVPFHLTMGLCVSIAISASAATENGRVGLFCFVFCLKKYWPCITPSMMSLVPLVSSIWEIVLCLVISPFRIWSGCLHKKKRWDQIIASIWITEIGCCQNYIAAPRSGQHCFLHGGSRLPKILLPITILMLLPASPFPNSTSPQPRRSWPMNPSNHCHSPP